MFKPGEIAKASQCRDLVTIQKMLVATPGTIACGGLKWPILTSAGIFDETSLLPAHPSVIATAEGRDRMAEPFQSDILARDGAARLPPDLRAKIEDAMSKATIDVNGHWKSGSIIADESRILERLFVGSDAMSLEDAVDFASAIDAGVAMNRWVPVDVGLRMLGLRACPLCGKDDFTTETNGAVLRIAGPPCEFASGFPLTEWDLNVPSGKLVVADDLRGVFPLPGGDDSDIGNAVGCRRTALAYAANGLAHAYVGNTCPGVFRCADGTFKIASEPNGEEWNGDKYVKVEPPHEFDGEEVARIGTDLWWYSICDYAELMRRRERFKNARDVAFEIVDVKPGVYRFRHDEEAYKRDGSGECIFSKFEWVREPDPVQDFLARYDAVDVNANAYVQAQVTRWPTLYGKTNGRRSGKVVPWSDMTEEDRAASWGAVADSLLCAGDTEWHEKGFPRANVDPAVPDAEPPQFRAQHHWAQLSESHDGLFVRKLSPSFAKLAFRVLESIISFGTGVRDGDRSRDVRDARQQMLVAAQRYRELAKKYPEQADPDYIAWLSQEGRTEAWVENFDLGPEFTEKHLENARRQRWVPDDAYAVAFDASELSDNDGRFARHPNEPGVGGCWAMKRTAKRYAIQGWSDNGQPSERNCFWAADAKETSAPLRFVARVVKLGEVSHMGETLVEIAFDYGTPWMRSAKRKALIEVKEKAAISVLSKEEYDILLPNAVAAFDEAEAAVERKALEDKRTQSERR